MQSTITNVVPIGDQIRVWVRFVGVEGVYEESFTYSASASFASIQADLEQRTVAKAAWEAERIALRNRIQEVEPINVVVE